MTHVRFTKTAICLSLIAGGVFGTACGGDAAFAPSKDAHVLLRSVRLSGHAYNLSKLSPYDTVTLHATVLLADGTAVSVPLRYSTVGIAVQVDSSTGFMRAVNAASFAGKSTVKVSATYLGQTVRDSAVVVVIDGMPVFVHEVRPTLEAYFGTPVTTLAFRWNATPVALIQPRAYDNAGNTIDGIAIASESSDSTVISSAAGSAAGEETVVTGKKPGEAWLRASTYAYNKYILDSAKIRVDEPQVYKIEVVTTENIRHDTLVKRVHFSPDTLVVGPGSDVVWMAPAPIVYGYRWSKGPFPPLPPGIIDSLEVTDSSVGPAIDVKFDSAQYSLVSNIPVLYGTDSTHYRDVINATTVVYANNEHGGSGDIAPFRIHVIGSSNPFGPDPCQKTIPVNCTLGREARRFTHLGVYHYHSSSGLQGVIIVK